ncbi:MAG: O-antigen ligase family protein [Gaiellaceae bacterium]
MTLAVAAVVFWLAYDGGTYSLVSRNTFSIAVWWTLGLGVALGLLPRARIPRAAWLVAGLLTGFAAWTGASIAWAPSAERAFNEFNRVTMYLGVFLLVVMSASSRTARRWADGLALGITATGLLSLASRCFPEHLPAGPIQEFLSDALNWPLNYSNGLGILVALGVPLLLARSLDRPLILRATAIGALPALAGAIYLTSSRGAASSALIATCVFLALTPDRWRTLAATLAASAGGAVVISVLAARPELVDEPQRSAAVQQGEQAALLIGLACVATAAAYAAAAFAFRSAPRPPAALGWAFATATAIALATGLALADPLSRFDEFRATPTPSTATPSVEGHLLSIGSTGRWQFWSAATDQWRAHLLAGEGAGSYEAWWAEHASFALFIRDAHSLYLETLGELGIAGFALLLMALLAGLAALLLRSRAGPTVAAVTAAFATFLWGAGIDWLWELTAVTTVGVACLGLGLAPRASARRRSRPARLAVPLVALGVALAAALPILSTAQLEDSQAAAARGDTRRAAGEAHAARDLQPWASSPYVQLALVAEQAGDLRMARHWIMKAIDRDGRDWRFWLVRARLETSDGAVRAARTSLQRAAELNPRSPLLAR